MENASFVTTRSLNRNEDVISINELVGMKPRVLLVDDEPDFVELMKFNLDRRGFEVITAVDGFEAVKKARAQAPDVILLDLMLPDLDGFSVCEILSIQLSTRDTPVIILSALDGAANRSRARKLRVVSYFCKGVEIDELEAQIRATVVLRKGRTNAVGEP